EFEQAPGKGFDPAVLARTAQNLLDPTGGLGLIVRVNDGESPRMLLILPERPGVAPQGAVDRVDAIRSSVDRLPAFPSGALLKPTPREETTWGSTTNPDAPERKRTFEQLGKTASFFTLSLRTATGLQQHALVHQ